MAHISRLAVNNVIGRFKEIQRAADKAQRKRASARPHRGRGGQHSKTRQVLKKHGINLGDLKFK